MATTTITSLAQAKAIAQAKEIKEAESKPNPRFRFKSPEFDNVIERELLKPGAMDPTAYIKMFNQVVAERGYTYDARPSMDDWNKKYPDVTPGDIEKLAAKDVEELMDAIKAPEHPNHNESRQTFANSFGGSVDNAMNFFRQKRSEIAGRHLLPHKNSSYEARFLNFGRIDDNVHKQFEAATFRNLMVAKWNAVGTYKDDEFKAKYLADYCVALQ